MDASLVFSKTPLGLDTIAHRTTKLDRRLRLALVLVDGESTISQLHRKAIGFAHLEHALEQLAMAGYIQALNGAWQPVNVKSRQGTTRPQGAWDAQFVKAKLIDAAILILGDEAERIIAVLKEAPDTEAGLQAAVSRCKTIVELTIDESRAVELKKKCLSILAKP